MRPAIDTLLGQSLIRLDPAGRVIGAAGLSSQPNRHQIQLDGHQFWTWRAYDILGIFVTLPTTGQVSSPSPTGGPPLEVSFRDGRPAPSTLALSLPDDDYAACYTNVSNQSCPNSNLFRTAEERRQLQWARSDRVGAHDGRSRQTRRDTMATAGRSPAHVTVRSGQTLGTPIRRDVKAPSRGHRRPRGRRPFRSIEFECGLFDDEQ